MKSKRGFMISDKKGISTVVETSLLILVSVVAVSLLVAFIMPMIKNKTSAATNCFDLRDYGKIVDIGYTYYTDTYTQLTIQRGQENYEILGFAVSIASGPSSKRYELKENVELDNVRMLTGADDYTDTIKLPGAGGAETYRFDDASGSIADLAVITLDGSFCNLGSFAINHQ